MIATISFSQTSFTCLIVAVATLSCVALAAANGPTSRATPQSLGGHQALNYLMFASSETARPATANDDDFRLQNLLKDSNHSHVSDAINLQLANTVWQRMRQNALNFAQQRTEEARPTINRLLEQANVGLACKQSLNSALDHLSKLDQWAVQSK